MNLNEERNQRIEDLKERLRRGEGLNIKKVCTLYRISEQTAREYIRQAETLPAIEKNKNYRIIAASDEEEKILRIIEKTEQKKQDMVLEKADKEQKKKGLKLFQSTYPNHEGFTRKWGTVKEVKKWIKEAEEVLKKG